MPTVNHHAGATKGIHGVDDFSKIARIDEDGRWLEGAAFPMASFRRAVAQRSVQTIDVGLLSDSIGEAVGSVSDRAGWVHFMRNGLAQRWNPAATAALTTEGFIPACHTPTAWPNRWTLSAGVDQAHHGMGWGLHSCTIHPGDTASLTVSPCTRLQVVYSQTPGGGTLTYTIDGGAATTVNTAGTAGSGYTSTPPTLGVGSHTVLVTNTSGANVVLDGAFMTNGDESLGVRLWNGSHAGFQLKDFADPANQPSLLAMARMNLDLLWIQLGVNDYIQGRTPNNVYDDLWNVLQVTLTAASNPKPSVVVAVPWPPSYATAAQFQPYNAAVRRAARYWGLAVVDGYQALGVDDGGSMWLDFVHPSAYGHIGYGEWACRILTGTEPLPAAVVGSCGTVDTWHAVTGGIGYTNGWTDYGTPYANAGYRLSNDGTRVELRGIIKLGTVNADAFTLPTGYRPAFPKLIGALANNALGGWLVNTTGAVRLFIGSNAYASLDGLSFDLAA